MILSIVIAISLGQICNTPTGITTFSDPPCANPTTHQFRLLADTTNKRLRFGHDGAWHFIAERGDPSIGIQSSSTPPAIAAIGSTYVDTSVSPPCLRMSTDGATWGACIVPVATDLERVPSYSSAPSLPAGDAATNRGARYFDTTLECTRSTLDGLTWDDCHTRQRCASFTVASPINLLALGSSTTTVTITGATVAQGHCSVQGPGTSFTVIGVEADCRITSTNTATVRFSGTLIGLGLTVAAGTYSACAQVKH